jgi:hypothetical protein
MIPQLTLIKAGAGVLTKSGGHTRQGRSRPPRFRHRATARIKSRDENWLVFAREQPVAADWLAQDLGANPPHGFSPCGHVANSSCLNHLQAFGGFVQILNI